MDKRFEQVEKRFEQIDKRFEQIDKRFEQVDKRFEQVDRQFVGDKRFEQIDKRLDLQQQEIRLIARKQDHILWEEAWLACLPANCFFTQSGTISDRIGLLQHIRRSMFTINGSILAVKCFFGHRSFLARRQRRQFLGFA